MPLKTVDATTLKTWLDKGEAVLVDVREPAENAAENIVGAKLIPLATIAKDKLPDCAGKKLVIHCRKGGRGGSACEKLLAEDPNLEIYNLEGGISAWADAGFTVKSSGKFFLPLDRQVQLAIGLFLLVANIMGYFVSSSYFIITALIGVGLTVAGLTGFCGMALIMAKMPWNASGESKNFCCTK